MAWIKLDDGFFRNPKIVSISPESKLIYLAGLCYVGSQLTDGFIPKNAVKMIGSDAAVSASPRRVKELVTAGLWVETPLGYSIHDYLNHNQSSESVRTKLDAAKERSQRSRSQGVRANFAQTKQEVREPDIEVDTDIDADQKESLSSESERDPAPEPPADPVNPKPVKHAPKPKASRLPSEFAITEAMSKWANESGYSPEFVAYETDKFRDYYASSPKTYLDWPATWRNWLRRSAESNPNAVSRINPTPSNVKQFSPYKKDIGLSNDELEAIARGEMVI